MFQQQGEKDSEKCWGKDATLFNSTVDAGGLRGAAVELYGALDVVVVVLNHALEFWWTAALWQDDPGEDFAHYVE